MDYARKVGKDPSEVPFKGREKIMRTLEEKIEIDLDRELTDIEKEIEKLPEEEQDVVLKEAMERSERVEEIKEEIKDVEEELHKLVEAIRTTYGLKPKLKVEGEPVSFKDLRDILTGKKWGAKWFE